MQALLLLADYFLQKMAAAICALSDEGPAEVDTNSLLGVLPNISLKILDIWFLLWSSARFPLWKYRPEFREEVTDEKVRDRGIMFATPNTMESNSLHRPDQGNSADGKSSITMCDEFNLKFSLFQVDTLQPNHFLDVFLSTIFVIYLTASRGD